MTAANHYGNPGDSLATEWPMNEVRLEKVWPKYQQQNACFCNIAREPNCNSKLVVSVCFQLPNKKS